MSASRLPRPTARVIVLDEDDRVLLILASDGEYRGSGEPVWLTPGGGLGEGETYEEAAVRELHEEVGLTGAALGPCVWLRRLPFALADGVPREKHERYFVCRVAHFEVSDISEEALDLEAVGGFRWWTCDEIEAVR
jgi:ADP-ribose pyrophosphatase YjhB (NUDIX family)